MRRPRSIAIAGLVVWLAAGGDVQAATFVVNTTTDAPESGICGTAPGACTFRDAVVGARKTAGRDTITFDPSVFPLGAPGAILLNDALRVIDDPAGTVIDGAGASVVISPAPVMAMGLASPDGRAVAPTPIDGIVFASAAATALANVTVANVTVAGFTGRGLVVCGGVPPLCEEDVAGTTLQNVVVLGNGGTGIEIRGRAIAKTRIATTVASNNGVDGIAVEAAGDIAGTRIERSTARGNDDDGFDLHPSGDARGTVVLDVVAVGNGVNGFRLLAGGTVEKTKLTGSVAALNLGGGFQLSGGQMTGITVAKVTASTNAGLGIRLTGSTLLAGATVKDTVANENGDGISLTASALVTGAKITKAKAAGNANGGISIGADFSVSNSKVSAVVVAGNGADGLRVRGSGNVVTRVLAHGNRGNGIHLIANDSGSGVGNKVTKCSGLANDGPGILLNVGVAQSIVQKNTSLASDSTDLQDLNPDCGTNVWKQNAFVTRFADCIQ
jgi:hypothetical protein